MYLVHLVVQGHSSEILIRGHYPMWSKTLKTHTKLCSYTTAENIIGWRGGGNCPCHINTRQFIFHVLPWMSYVTPFSWLLVCGNNFYPCRVHCWLQVHKVAWVSRTWHEKIQMQSSSNLLTSSKVRKTAQFLTYFFVFLTYFLRIQQTFCMYLYGVGHNRLKSLHVLFVLFCFSCSKLITIRGLNLLFYAVLQHDVCARW